MTSTAASQFDDGVGTEPLEELNNSRGLLFGIAYRVLGRVADAEDAVQDAWLREGMRWPPA